MFCFIDFRIFQERQNIKKKNVQLLYIKGDIIYNCCVLLVK